MECPTFDNIFLKLASKRFQDDIIKSFSVKNFLIYEITIALTLFKVYQVIIKITRLNLHLHLFFYMYLYVNVFQSAHA